MKSEISKYGDDAMYGSQPMRQKEGVLRVTPQVFLINATPDPLGTCAADMRMYRGDPVYSLDEITDDQRRWAWEELSKTALNTPLEGVSLKFMIEGVTRAFTHQIVRQRVGAYYVQESLRFAVKEGLAQEVALPPSIVAPEEGLQGEPAWEIWSKTVLAIEKAYTGLVNAGIPAEDARGLLPHAVTTRIIYHTNLRALFEHAGNRLCTQAQFEWRSVFMQFMLAISKHKNQMTVLKTKHGMPGISCPGDDAWQWKIIAEPRSHTFTPICYRLGRCAFMSELDRGCTIRERVEAFHDHGVPSDEWNSDEWDQSTETNGNLDEIELERITPMEWLANPRAGITDNETNVRPPAAS